MAGSKKTPRHKKPNSTSKRARNGTNCGNQPEHDFNPGVMNFDVSGKDAVPIMSVLAKRQAPTDTKQQEQSVTEGNRQAKRLKCGKQSEQDCNSGIVTFDELGEHCMPIMSVLATKIPNEPQHQEQSVTEETRQEKRFKSEQRRKKAFEEMRTRKSQPHSQLPDSEPQSRHVVFRESDGESSEHESDECVGAMEDEVDAKTVSRSSGSQSPTEKPQLMRLFEDDSGGSDVDSDQDDDAKHFAPKPQFEGKSGKKLHRLQQKIGHDERFQLDTRFVSDDEASEAEKSSEDEEKSFQKQISQEKKVQLEIVSKMLGRGPISSETNTAYRSTSLFQPLRYDPTSKHCQDLELDRPGRKASPPLQNKMSAGVKEGGLSGDVSEDRKAPLTSKERFYSVQMGEMKDAFSGNIGEAKESKKPTSGFLFQGLFDSTLDSARDDDARPVHQAKAGESGALKPAIEGTELSWLSKKGNPIASSSDEEDNKMESKTAKGSVPELSSTRFFFHPTNSSLRNRLIPEFTRTQSHTELNKAWPAMRTAYKQSFRQRRKDALRAKKRLCS